MWRKRITNLYFPAHHILLVFHTFDVQHNLYYNLAKHINFILYKRRFPFATYPTPISIKSLLKPKYVQNMLTSDEHYRINLEFLEKKNSNTRLTICGILQKEICNFSFYKLVEYKIGIRNFEARYTYYIYIVTQHVSMDSFKCALLTSLCTCVLKGESWGCVQKVCFGINVRNCSYYFSVLI